MSLVRSILVSRVAQSRSHRHVLAAAFVAASIVLAACGTTSEPVKTDTTKTPPPPPAKDTVPATVTATTNTSVTGVVGTAISTPVTVIVKNKAGESLDGVLVTFAVTGGGTIVPPSIRTANGTATATWTLGPAVGAQTATATVSGLTPVSYTATATSAAAAKLVVVAGDNQTAVVGTNVAVNPSVKVTDQFDNPVAGATVTFAVAGGLGSVTGASATTNASGIATVGSWKLGPTVGTSNNILTATSGSLTATFRASSTPAAAATIQLTTLPATELNAGDTTRVAGKVFDANGNLITNAVITFSSSSSAVLTVDNTGKITGAGAGTATITATSGNATIQTAAIKVFGHPRGAATTDSIGTGAAAGDVAFTSNATLISRGNADTVLHYDANATTNLGSIPFPLGVPLLVGPTNATAPAAGINPGTTSLVWLIDPNLNIVADTIHVDRVAIRAAMSAGGARVYLLNVDGTITFVDLPLKTVVATVSLGLGAGAQMRLAVGDSFLYVPSSLGTIQLMNEIDTRTAVIRRSFVVASAATDFQLSRDGKHLFMLIGGSSVVRIVNVATGAQEGSVAVSPNGVALGVSPDLREVWVAHNGTSIGDPSKVTVMTGALATGYSFGRQYIVGGTPTGVYMSPTGALVAISNSGGWVNIAR